MLCHRVKQLFFIYLLLSPVKSASLGLFSSDGDSDESTTIKDLAPLLQAVMVKTLVPYKCVALISDDYHWSLFDSRWYSKFGSLISFITIHVAEAEDLLSPFNTTQQAMRAAKTYGCQLHIILIANGLQVARLMRFGERYRVLNTRSKFILNYDAKLFDKSLFYLWKRIIDVIFIRRFEGGRKNIPWYEITTVPFPSGVSSILVPRRLDIWTRRGFRKSADFFKDKTADLRSQTLRVAVFVHIPGSVRHQLGEMRQRGSGARTFGTNGTFYSGAEVEILQTVASTMNFQCDIYEPEDIAKELWGGKQTNGKFTGLIGEMVYTRADIALGDLYYTPYVLDLMDLSVPYNTECLTFVTPEALFDNSWKTLILPFKPLMWLAVILCLVTCGLVFHYLSRFHLYINTIIDPSEDTTTSHRGIVTLSLSSDFGHVDKYTMMRETLYKFLDRHNGVARREANGLYQFSEGFNSILYTYSMLLLVSIPKLPKGWSLRVLTGWYWLYCLLLVVAYRASMTAILSTPPPRVTIDSLQELVDSGLPCGGWGDINRDFFANSLDPLTRRIGTGNFEIVDNSTRAIERAAKATFAFYENNYYLKQEMVRLQRDSGRDLHIMSDCVIKMPISIGLQKSSPVKQRVDRIIRRVLEAGLIKKWLDDVMAPVLNAEVHKVKGSGRAAIMNMRKFFGAIVALFIGYFVSVVVLVGEVVYFRYYVARQQGYNKYSRSVVVKKGQ